MNALRRWEPVREMQTMRSLMDRFFDEPFFAAPQLWSQRGEGFPLALDLIEEENQYIVKASMPGVEPDQVEITLTDNMLTIKGETRGESESDRSNYHVRERHYGSFVRHLALPAAVDAEHVEATHENGVLTLRLPKTEATKPKRISVKTTVNGNTQEKTNPQGNGNANVSSQS